MTHIILDTSILLRYPRILGLRLSNITFIIPRSVLLELGQNHAYRGGPYVGIMKLLEKALDDGTVHLIGAPWRKTDPVTIKSNLSGDTDIISVALLYSEKGETVKIATLDQLIQKFALEKQIDVLGSQQVETLLDNFKMPENKDSSIQSDIVSYEKKEKRTLWLGIIIGIAVAVVAFVIYQNAEKIFSTINVWGTIVLIILIGVSLFVFREKNRLSYGVFEFLVGVIAIILLFQPSKFNLSTIDFNLDFNVKLLGGLYIMVRGQDNIVKAIKDTKAGLFLRDKFGIGI